MNKIIEVTRAQADEIVKERVPFGKYILEQKGKFYGIENSCGDACVEIFKNREECLEWLKS